jgi:hypothetical protein
MRIEVKHPAFKMRRLEVEPASFLAGPKLFLNDVLQKHKGSQYTIASDSGQELPVKVLFNFLDPIPKLKIADDTLLLAKPLQWYEYVWIGIPMLLVFFGGAVGGFIGAGSTVINGRIFRSDRRASAKYGLAVVTTIGATATFFAIAVAIQIATGKK